MRTRDLLILVAALIAICTLMSCAFEPSEESMVLTSSMTLGNQSKKVVLKNKSEIYRNDSYNLCSDGPHVFLPETFQRNYGEPVTETRTFYVPMRTKACMVVKNGGISSAWIKVDGLEVFGPGSFNHNVEETTDTFTIDEGDHELSVRLASKPGNKLSIEIRLGIEISVDPRVEPPFETLPDYFGNGDVPIAAVTTSDGKTLSYAANQLILLTDFTSELESVLQTYSGEVILEVNYRDIGIELPNAYLISLDPQSHSLSTFEQDLAANIREYVDGATLMGELRFSSEEGALLMAIAATEVRAGKAVTINYLEEPSGIPQSHTTEALQERPAHPNYVRDAYQWAYLAKGNDLDTGAADAWTVLYYLGLLEDFQKRRIGIIDAGFHRTAGGDIPEFDKIELGGFEPVIGSRNHWPGHAWHGTRVAMTATAVPDNEFGTAGTGGPVAKPLYILASPWGGLNLIFIMPACVWHSDICNMSGNAYFHWTYSWATYPVFDPVTAACSYGGLLIASAGNDGENNNSKTCAPPFDWPCWETWRNLPCEGTAVQCIGGLGEDGCRHEHSNWGDVDLWAPYKVYVGWNPDQPVQPPHYDNFVEKASGTSFSSPFVAGAVATVWRACRGCDFDHVFDILQDTAHESPPHCTGNKAVDRKIDVFDAVLSAHGFDIQAEIVNPVDGSVVNYNRTYSFVADLKVISLSGDPFNLVVMWESDIDGVLGAESFTIDRQLDLGVYRETSNLDFALSEGQHEITVTAVFWGQPNLKAEYTIHVTAANTAPHSVNIIKPEDGREFCEGEQILFLGEATDWNQDLTDSNFEWLSTIQPVQRFGVGKELEFDGLIPGEHTIQLLVTDDHNETGTEYVDITVLPSSDPNCSNLPPYVKIIQPEFRDVFHYSGYDGIYPIALVDLIGEAIDPEHPEDVLSVEWRSDYETGILGSSLEVEDAILHVWTPPYNFEMHIIELVATDCDGRVSSDSVPVFVMGPEI